MKYVHIAYEVFDKTKDEDLSASRLVRLKQSLLKIEDDEERTFIWNKTYNNDNELTFWAILDVYQRHPLAEILFVEVRESD